MCWLIPRLNQFHQAHPQVETRVIYAMHGRDIDVHNTHLAFVFATKPPQLPNFDCTFFLPGDSVPVCSPSLLQKLGRHPVSPAEYRALGLLHDGDTAGWQDWLTQPNTPTPPITGARFEDFNLLRSAALSGQGVALCPLSMVQPDITAGSLVQLSDRVALGGGDYYLLATQTGGQNLAAQAQIFTDWAMAVR